MKKILITGAAGFIGSHVSERIFNEYKKSKILLYDKITYAANLKYLSKILKKKNVYFIKSDLLNYKVLERSLKNVEIIGNSGTAGIPSYISNILVNLPSLLQQFY